MLETPGPALVNTFLPPPPSPSSAVGDAEENEGAEEGGESTNLAYEDLLAKLVLPAKAAEPEPAMPTLAAPLPMPETSVAPAEPTPPAAAFQLPSTASFQTAPPSDERTLVTANPLVAEEQEAAVREGRVSLREPQPIMVHDEMRPAVTEPMMALGSGATKSRFFYLMMGGLLVLGGFLLAVLFLKLIMPTPTPPAPVILAPAAPLPPAAPPAHVEPLPPSSPPAAAAPAPAPASAPLPPAAAEPAPAAEMPAGAEAIAPDTERAQPKPRKAAVHRGTRAAPKPASSPKAAAAPKASRTPKATPKAAAKKAKSTGYADPFDN